MPIQIQRNLKATSLLNISLGLFLSSVFLDHLIKGNANFMTYIGITLAALLILVGLYNYFILLKNQELIQDKKYGYLSLIIGILFLISTTISWINLKTSIISVILGSASGILAIVLGAILLKKD